MNTTKIGLYLIGARGQVASTVIVGALGLAKGLIPPTALTTETAPFQDLDLVPWAALRPGGMDIRPIPIQESAAQVLRPAGLEGLLEPHQDDLARLDAAIDPGVTIGCGEAIRALAENGCGDGGGRLTEIAASIRDRIARFRDRIKAERVVVVNVASTEPPLVSSQAHASIRGFEQALAHNDLDLVRASSLYAYAAIMEGCAFINFTPSNGALTPALIELAERERVPVMGNDGKTGETLVKSALGPMFFIRNLKVLSWQGYNILGNTDGRVLAHADNRASKVQSKDRVLPKVLGYQPHTQVGIDYVPSLGDQKVAWDFIHFEGFLGARMAMQFTWQGYDSILAAPLILDMVRLAEFSMRRGEAGLMKHLACFFKDPLDVPVQNLNDQYRLLLDYVHRAAVAAGRHENVALFRA